MSHEILFDENGWLEYGIFPEISTSTRNHDAAGVHHKISTLGPDASNSGIGTDVIDDHEHTSEAESKPEDMSNSNHCLPNLQRFTSNYEVNEEFSCPSNPHLSAQGMILSNDRLSKTVENPHTIEMATVNDRLNPVTCSATNDAFLPLRMFGNPCTRPIEFEGIDISLPFTFDDLLSDRISFDTADDNEYFPVPDLCLFTDASPDFLRNSYDVTGASLYKSISTSIQDRLSSCTQSSTPSSSQSAGLRRRRKEVPEVEWRRIKPHLYQLYFLEGRPLRSVMQLLSDNHNFKASEQLFKNHIKKWGMTRNLRTAEKLKIINDLLSSTRSRVEAVGISQDEARKMLRFAQAQHKAGRLKALEYQTIQFKLEKSMASSRLQEVYSDAIKYFCNELQQINPRIENLLIEKTATDIPGISKVTPKKQNASERTVHSSPNGWLHLFEEVLDAANPSLRPFSRRQLQSLEAAIDDVRIFGRLNAFTSGMRSTKNFLAERVYGSNSFACWLLPFMPYLCADMWLSIELPSVLVYYISGTVETTMGDSHPAARLFNHLQQRLPDSQDQFNLWTALADRYAARSSNLLDLWLTLAIQAIQSARRTNRLTICADFCQKIMNMLMSMNKLTDEHRAVLLFEQARALSASGSTSHAERLMREALNLAAEAKMHRLKVKIDLRLAELYSRLSPKISLEEKHCISAFRRSLKVFGHESALTMLALSKTIDCCKRQHKRITTVIPSDEYQAAHDYYVRINDLSEGIQNVPRTA